MLHRIEGFEVIEGRGSPELTTAMAQSREAAERLWAEIGRLLAAARPVTG